MNLQQYQQESRRTSPTLGSDKLDLCHMVLGMVSELPEIDGACLTGDKNKIGDEVADEMWYVANYCTLRNYDLNEIGFYSSLHKLNLLELTVHLLSDKVKKFVAYDKPIDENDEKSLLLSIIKNCKVICELYDLDFEQQLDKNIAKLRVRFPEKFTKELAINRNLDAERVELEK